jgi:hypothetical protein
VARYFYRNYAVDDKTQADKSWSLTDLAERIKRSYLHAQFKRRKRQPLLLTIHSMNKLTQEAIDFFSLIATSDNISVVASFDSDAKNVVEKLLTESQMENFNFLQVEANTNESTASEVAFLEEAAAKKKLTTEIEKTTKKVKITREADSIQTAYRFKHQQ